AAQDVGRGRGVRAVGPTLISDRERRRPAVADRLQIQPDVPVSVPVSRRRRFAARAGGEIRGREAGPSASPCHCHPERRKDLLLMWPRIAGFLVIASVLCAAASAQTKPAW